MATKQGNWAVFLTLLVSAFASLIWTIIMAFILNHGLIRLFGSGIDFLGLALLLWGTAGLVRILLK